MGVPVGVLLLNGGLCRPRPPPPSSRAAEGSGTGRRAGMPAAPGCTLPCLPPPRCAPRGTSFGSEEPLLTLGVRAPLPPLLHPVILAQPRPPVCSGAGDPQLNTLRRVTSKPWWAQGSQGPGRVARWEGASWRKAVEGSREAGGGRVGLPRLGLLGGAGEGVVAGRLGPQGRSQLFGQGPEPPSTWRRSERSPWPPQTASVPGQTELAAAGQMGWWARSPWVTLMSDLTAPAICSKAAGPGDGAPSRHPQCPHPGGHHSHSWAHTGPRYPYPL